jgi:hypothetical protein
MPDEPKPPTDDLERLQRYLQWRDRTNEAARSSVRRRRLRGVVVAGVVALVGVATLSWLSFGIRDSRPVAREDVPAGNTVHATDLADAGAGVTSDAQAAPPTTPPASTEPLASTAPPTSSASPVPTPPPVATAPQVIERAPVAPKPSPNASRRTARTTARTPARAATPDPIRADPVDESTSPSAGTSDPSATPDPATSASVAMPDIRPQSTSTERFDPAPNERHDSAPPVEAATPSTAPSLTVAATPPAHNASAQNAPVVVTAPAAPPVVENPPVAPTPPVAQPPVTVAPGTVTSIESKPPCDDVTAAESADGRSPRQRVSDCVGGWLKGQSRQFGDGVKREVDDFRTGLDQVGRGLQWLGSKLRRPE